jgi:ribulose-5-phosphate 4-epimerase/fuculose-1-phosphate aldolase
MATKKTAKKTVTKSTKKVVPSKATRATTAAAIEDLVAASRILAMYEVLDAFGHVSIRHPEHPNRYLISRSLAPELLTAADLMEFDLDSNSVRPDDRKPFTERFIHGQIYKSRPDVMAVVHSHSPSVVPFGAVGQGLRPIYHMSGFLHSGTPIFDIRDTAGHTDMLVRDNYLAVALTKTLGARSVALMRGHGNVVVAPDVRLVVYRAIYSEMNARLQLQAKILGGTTTFLSTEEAQLAEKANIAAIDRPWQLWKAKAMAQMKKR